MESNWRLNVWRFGMDYGVTQLAARLQGFPNRLITNQQFGAPANSIAVYLVVDAQYAVFSTAAPKPNPNVNFPYGFLVEQDSPV